MIDDKKEWRQSGRGKVVKSIVENYTALPGFREKAAFCLRATKRGVQQAVTDVPLHRLPLYGMQNKRTESGKLSTDLREKSVRHGGLTFPDQSADSDRLCRTDFSRYKVESCRFLFRFFISVSLP